MGGSSYDVIGGMNECNAHMYEGLPTKLKQILHKACQNTYHWK